MGIKRLNLLIGIVVLLITCFIVIQLFWVNNTFRMQKHEMTRKINEVVANVCMGAEEDFTCFETRSDLVLSPGEGIYAIKNVWRNNNFLPSDSNKVDTIRQDLFYIYEKDTFYKSYGSLRFSYPVKMEMKMKFSFLSFDSTEKSETFDYYEIDTNLESKISRQKKHLQIRAMVDSAAIYMNLKKGLSKLGINERIGFGFRNEQTQKMEMISKGTLIKQLQKSPYSALLFADKYTGYPFRLFLYVPDQTMAASSLWGILATSGLLTIAMIVTFWYFIRIIMRQKKLSEMKTDFINNLTHEFKTPITNISLATETLSERNGMGLKRLLKIIDEENNRLKENVERILQMAFWEHSEPQLHLESVDLHQLIEAEAEKFNAFGVFDSKQIICNLQASNFVIHADRMHLQNVISNLIENAIKYSQQMPEIVIQTKNESGHFEVSIKDNGIGMDRETQTHIFDKFYRAHTGDVHNVKGFGLGLSYVQTIVEKHGGSIAVSSEPGKGSVFSLLLPLDGNKITN